MDHKEQLDRIEAKLDTLLGLRRPNSRKQTKRPVEPIQWPTQLNVSTFKLVWDEWIKHRRNKASRLTPEAVKRQLKLLTEVAEREGVEGAIAVIEQSITRGWTGLFECKDGKLVSSDGEYYPG